MTLGGSDERLTAREPAATIGRAGGEHVIEHEQKVVVAFGAPPRVEREGARLADVVGEDEPRHFVGHRREQPAALRLSRQSALTKQEVEQDLDVDFVVRHADTAGVVHRVGVDQAALLPILDACALREPEVAAFGHDTRPQIRRRDANPIVRPVGNRLVVFRRRPHIGADTAVVEQIDLRAEHPADDLLTAGRRLVDAK